MHAEFRHFSIYIKRYADDSHRNINPDLMCFFVAAVVAVVVGGSGRGCGAADFVWRMVE